MSSIIQFLVYIFVSLFVYCLTYFTFGTLSCVCACSCVFVSLCPSPSCTKMYKNNTSVLLSHFFCRLGFTCVRVYVYFHLRFSSKVFILLLSWFFSFASVCETPNSCDQAKIKLTLKMSVTIQCNIVSYNKSRASQCPPSVFGGQFASMWVW